MLHIRLRRGGKRKQPIYRLIVCEKTKDPWGDYLENLGTFNPRSTPPEVNFNTEHIKEWIAKGAQCSDTVWNMLLDQGVVTGAKRKTVELSKKRHAKMEKAGADKKAAAEAKEAKAAAEAEAKRQAAEEAKAAAEAAKAEAEAAPAVEEVPASEEAPAE
ncbi:MAG: 30S ribosomal protein S16 [Patescibacteria group bacterium]